MTHIVNEPGPDSEARDCDNLVGELEALAAHMFERMGDHYPDCIQRGADAITRLRARVDGAIRNSAKLAEERNDLSARVVELERDSDVLHATAADDKRCIAELGREKVAAMTERRPDAIRGIAALEEALGIIGQEGKDDHAMAKIVCDNEVELRALVNFALFQML